MQRELWQVVNDNLSNVVTTIPEEAIFVIPVFGNTGSPNYKDWSNNQDTLNYYKKVNYVMPTEADGPEASIRVAEYLIASATEKGDLVVDPFVDDGSMGIACMNTGRRYLGIEPDMERADTINDRLAENGIRMMKAGKI